MVKQKNILIISAADPYKSAGVVALDLYEGLSKIEGNNVVLLTKFCVSNNQDIKSFLTPIENNAEKVKRKLMKILVKTRLVQNKMIDTLPDYHVLDFDQTKTFYKTKTLLRKAKIQPDHIIIVFTQNFISFKNIHELNKLTKARVYLYPMDMAHFTGACHYSWDCNRYSQKCGTCPALFSNDENDQSHRNLDFKAKYIEKTDITLFAGNTQMFNQLKFSSLFRDKETYNNIFPVPNQQVFRALDKEKYRIEMKLEEDNLVFFFGSVSLSEKRKGVAVLLESLEIIAANYRKTSMHKREIVFLIAGNKFPENFVSTLPFKIRHVGYLHNYSDLATMYNVADFFICPSLEDSGPTMILQSMLCNTPTISFDIGFATDFIQDRVNGLIAKDKTSMALSECLTSAINLSKTDYLQLKQELQKTSLKIDAQKILNEIQNILENDIH